MLQNIWFILWGLLWAVYFLLDGFDLGLGTLMPFIAKDETEKRIVYNAIGPFWDGNEVWLITAGGVTFAAFPGAYSVMFSSFYSALMLILFALIVRGVSVVFRSEVDSAKWKKLWDWGLFVGSALPAFLFGVVFANIFRGIPIGENGIYQGSLLTLLNIYGLIGGALFLLLFLVHGAVWLAVKSDGELNDRAVSTARKLWVALLIAAVVFFIASAISTNLYKNYLEHPVLFAIPLIAVVALLLSRYFLSKGKAWSAWAMSGLTIVFATFFGVVGLYPNMLPSSIDPAFSVTIFNSASSPKTLKIMLAVALTFVPIVIAYQAWVYNLFKDKVTKEDLAHGEGY